MEEISEFRSMPRVTSDCVPFRADGRLFVCGSCSAAQSPADQQWFDEIGQIYGAYRIYPQSGGIEQHVVDPATGQFRRRSEVLLDRLSEIPGFPGSGSVVDIGCGNGGTLRAFAGRGGWSLNGLEINEANLAELTSIPGFHALHTGKPRDLPGRFDVVTMVHALEHFPSPLPVLKDLHSKIAPGGRLFVEVPDALANPFDYLIADHMVHFSGPALGRLATAAGYRVECLSDGWVQKELSMTAIPQAQTQRWDAAAGGESAGRVRAQLAWLHRVADAARKSLDEAPQFGIFGTSIAASWMCGLLGDGVAFFVDEDTNRVGHTHLRRPILSPAQVPPGAVVFAALIPRIAHRVAGRLAGAQFELRMPPE
ncbi:MAG TPA: class I SAM-dependent methyltransferase [Candidatus Acidoferrales bacterium]|nr:class I SAM-dependent methyltransferase [Candidatus Acidoferrales bacterium]